MGKNNNSDDNINYSVDDFNLEPSDFLNIKKGDELKNKKKLKTILTEIDKSLNTIEDESYAISLFLELLVSDDASEKLSGDNCDAIDIINSLSEKINNISIILEEIKQTKNNI